MNSHVTEYFHGLASDTQRDNLSKYRTLAPPPTGLRKGKVCLTIAGFRRVWFDRCLGEMNRVLAVFEIRDLSRGPAIGQAMNPPTCTTLYHAAALFRRHEPNRDSGVHGALRPNVPLPRLDQSRYNGNVAE